MSVGNLLFVCVCILAAISGSALKALPPRDYVPPTYAQQWDTSKFVVYGRVIGLERKNAAAGQTDYEVTFKIERCWKGAISGEIVISDTLPHDCDDNSYRFEFYKTYVIFAGKGEDTKYRRYSADRITLPLEPVLPYIGLELTAFLEDKTGDRLGAAEIKALQAKKARDERTFNEEFSKAMDETRLVERNALLEALDKKLRDPSASEEASKRIQAVASELSIANTYLENGIKKLPSSTPTNP